VTGLGRPDARTAAWSNLDAFDRVAARYCQLHGVWPTVVGITDHHGVPYRSVRVGDSIGRAVRWRRPWWAPLLTGGR
jgi:hypothetical protein